MCIYQARERPWAHCARALRSHHKPSQRWSRPSPRPDVQVHIDINLSAEPATAQGSSRSVLFGDGTGTWNTGTTPTHFIALHEVSFHQRALKPDIVTAIVKPMGALLSGTTDP